MKRTLALCAVGLLSSAFSPHGFGQSLGNAGTVAGTVVDPSGAAVPKAAVSVRNAVTGYSQTTAAASDGSFRLTNVPPNPYHLAVSAPGFAPSGRFEIYREAWHLLR